jgi:hypothetical protein
MGRQPTFKQVRTGNRDIDRIQDNLRETLQPVLSNPIISAENFRFSEAAGVNGAPPTFALQFRTPGSQTWQTVGHFDSAGGYHTP